MGRFHQCKENLSVMLWPFWLKPFLSNDVSSAHCRRLFGKFFVPRSVVAQCHAGDGLQSRPHQGGSMSSVDGARLRNGGLLARTRTVHRGGMGWPAVSESWPRNQCRFNQGRAQTRWRQLHDHGWSVSRVQSLFLERQSHPKRRVEEKFFLELLDPFMDADGFRSGRRFAQRIDVVQNDFVVFFSLQNFLMKDRYIAQFCQKKKKARVFVTRDRSQSEIFHFFECQPCEFRFVLVEGFC